MDVGISDLADASYHIEQMLYEPVISSKFSSKKNTVFMDVRVMAGDNVIVWELRTDREFVTVDLRLWVKDGYGSETAEGRDRDLFWVSRKFKTDDLMFPTEATLAVRCLESSGRSLILEPGKPIFLVASVMTNHESDRYHGDVLRKVSGINHDEIRKLRSEHDLWWRRFWALSFVRIEDKLLEKHYYASQYILACCSRNVHFPPGLYGNWITKDRTAWSGDYHLDYNYEAPYWAVFSSNHVELADPYDTPLLEQLPAFIKDARSFLNKKGAYVSVAIGPKSLALRYKDKPGLREQYKGKIDDDPFDDIAGQPMFCGMKSHAVFASMNMILRYHYTYDQDYIRKVYPYLIAVADFWEDYLKFERNRYVIPDDSVYEVGPWNGNQWRARERLLFSSSDIRGIPCLLSDCQRRNPISPDRERKREDVRHPESLERYKNIIIQERKKIRNTGRGSVVVCHKIGRSHHPCPRRKALSRKAGISKGHEVVEKRD